MTAVHFSCWHRCRCYRRRRILAHNSSITTSLRTGGTVNYAMVTRVHRRRIERFEPQTSSFDAPDDRCRRTRLNAETVGDEMPTSPTDFDDQFLLVVESERRPKTPRASPSSRVASNETASGRSARGWFGTDNLPTCRSGLARLFERHRRELRFVCCPTTFVSTCTIHRRDRKCGRSAATDRLRIRNRRPSPLSSERSMSCPSKISPWSPTRSWSPSSS